MQTEPNSRHGGGSVNVKEIEADIEARRAGAAVVDKVSAEGRNMIGVDDSISFTSDNQ